MRNHIHVILSICILTATVMLTGCTSPVKSMKASDTLEAGEGVLVLRIHTTFRDTRLIIESLEGEGPARTEVPSFDGIQTLFMRLPEGKYQVESIFAGTAWFYLRSNPVFHVREGILGYGGDLYFTRKGSTWRDEQSEIESYIRAKAPSVLERYEIDYIAEFD
ncbi:MAG: hypothetical protein R3270_00740 [Gammaproteobacteria bacterium]|nr:hypothetical protein [Gammaproteobacteria bacterium]